MNDTSIASKAKAQLAGGRVAHPWGTVTARTKIDDVSPMVWGKYEALDKPVVDNLEKMAKAKCVPMAQLALAWMLSKPHITAPIVDTTSERHIEEAVAALDVKLSDEEIAALEVPYVPHQPVDNNGQLAF